MAQELTRISDVIIHKFIKEQHGPASSEIRPAPVGITPAAERLINHLHKRYSEKTAKGYGKFEDDEDNFPMSRIVKDWHVSNEKNFYETSRRMMDHLVARAVAMTTGGFVLIAHVHSDDKEFLLVAIITEELGSAITENLDIEDRVYVDLSNLRVAGRIDLSGWIGGDERYIGFLRGKQDIATYFKLFLGCNDTVEAARETGKLIDGLEQFFALKEMPSAERDAIRTTANEHLKQLADDKTPFAIDAFCNRMWPNEPEELATILRAEALQLSDGFIPDGRSLRRLVKIKASTQYWKLEFERSGLHSGAVEYKPETQTLILSSLPQHLLAELEAETRDDPAG